LAGRLGGIEERNGKKGNFSQTLGSLFDSKDIFVNGYGSCFRFQSAHHANEGRARPTCVSLAH
jgi:hypothetical protein